MTTEACHSSLEKRIDWLGGRPIRSRMKACEVDWLV